MGMFILEKPSDSTRRNRKMPWSHSQTAQIQALNVPKKKKKSKMMTTVENYVNTKSKVNIPDQ